MLYDFIEFRNTMIKLYYRINIKNNKNTTVASNDKQMLSNKKKSSNDKKKVIDQLLKFQNTKISATALNANTLSAIIFGANAFNAAALSAFNRTKSEKTFQSSSLIKRGRDCFQKQSIIQLKNQSNLSIFLLSEINSLISLLRIWHTKSRQKKSTFY